MVRYVIVSRSVDRLTQEPKTWYLTNGAEWSTYKHQAKKFRSKFWAAVVSRVFRAHGYKPVITE